MFSSSITIRSITIVRDTGTVDRISIAIDGPSPFPELADKKPEAYPAFISAETRKGYAHSWLVQVFGKGVLEQVPVKVIDL